MNVTKITSLVAVAVLALTANTAMAQGYGGLSYFDWSVKQTGTAKLESGTLRATGGYMFSDIFGVEVHVATGGSDDLDFGGEDAEAELNKMLGLFAKLNQPLNVMGVESNIYGLAGYGYGRVDILAETTKTRINENSFAWGAGADVVLTDRLSLTADYVNYISRTGVDASAASLGLRLAFGQ